MALGKFRNVSDWVVGVIQSVGGKDAFIQGVTLLDQSGNAATFANPTLGTGTDRSGTATTSASTLAPSNANRTFLVGQNIGANNIWINEIGGTAAANTAGSYKVIPGNSFSISTNRAVSVIAETGSTAYTATEG